MNLKGIQQDTRNFRSIFDSVDNNWENKDIYRSELLSKVKQFSENEDETIYLLDIRSNTEKRNENYQPIESNVIYTHMPMYGEAESLGNSPTVIDNFNTMGDMYVYIVENFKEGIKNILDWIIQKRNSSIIIHCTAGKDRTGVIVMMLLEMLEVDQEAIIESYAKSHDNLSEFIAEKKAKVSQSGATIPDYIFDSKPSDMQQLYNHLEHQYGSVHAYLNDIGMNETKMNEFSNYVKGNKNG